MLGPFLFSHSPLAAANCRAIAQGQRSERQKWAGPHIMRPNRFWEPSRRFPKPGFFPVSFSWFFFGFLSFFYFSFFRFCFFFIFSFFVSCFTFFFKFIFLFQNMFVVLQMFMIFFFISFSFLLFL